MIRYFTLCTFLITDSSCISTKCNAALGPAPRVAVYARVRCVAECGRRRPISMCCSDSRCWTPPHRLPSASSTSTNSISSAPTAAAASTIFGANGWRCHRTSPLPSEIWLTLLISTSNYEFSTYIFLSFIFCFSTHKNCSFRNRLLLFLSLWH